MVRVPILDFQHHASRTIYCWSQKMIEIVCSCDFLSRWVMIEEKPGH